MEPELMDRNAVVTGGGRGIGRAIAHALAGAGASVVAVARSESQLSETAASLGPSPGRIVPVAADVTDENAVAEMVEQAERETGPIDILVNNAGSCRAVGPLWTADAERWREDIEASLFGTLMCTRAVLPRMVARRTGRIINVSSYAAIRPSPYMSPYGSAKAAVLHLTNSLAAETKDYGISVFAVTPGTVHTGLTEDIMRAAAGQELPHQLVSKKWIPAERVGELAVFLAAGKADSLSGRFLHVLDPVADLVERADEVERDDLYVLRLRT
jgi:NAD(P)-dependent dehydrogenase (short-subunit alcohol dehydrogenase family)